MEQVQSLPPHQQQMFMKHLEEMQMTDSLTWVSFVSKYLVFEYF
jgi:hypothetical protein